MSITVRQIDALQHYTEQAQHAAALERIKALAAALRKFGLHKIDCDAGINERYACSCGLSAALLEPKPIQVHPLDGTACAEGMG